MVEDVRASTQLEKARITELMSLLRTERLRSSEIEGMLHSLRSELEATRGALNREQADMGAVM